MLIRDKLKTIGQEQVLAYWDQLSSEEKKSLKNQINAIDFQLFKEMQERLSSSPCKFQGSPFSRYCISGNQKDRELGLDLISQNRTGCLILAGGEGSRLGFEGPKGTFPLMGRSLFEILASRIAKIDPALSLMVMTSTKNHKKTVEFWYKHDHFGLKNVDFIPQGDLPFLDKEKNLFLDSPYHIASGADGNGSVYRVMKESGIFKKWKEKGILYVNIILVDNALAEPFDPELIGFHNRKKSQITVKSAKRINYQEKVGVVVSEGTRTRIIEYSELEKNNEGDFCANLGMFCMNLDFMEKAADIDLPLHANFKASTMLKDNKIVQSEKPNAWKFERFIFDVLPYAEQVEVLLYPREQCFAPLKNRFGADSPETVVEKLKMR